LHGTKIIGCGRNAADIDRVVGCAAHDVAIRKPESPRRGTYGIDATRVEARRRKLVDLPHFAFKPELTRNALRGVAQLAIHRRKCVVVGMAHVDAHCNMPWNDIARIRAHLHESHSGSTVYAIPQCQRIGRFNETRSSA